MLRLSALLSLVVLCCALLAAALPQCAVAEGALALGLTGDIAKDGYSIGITANDETEAVARQGALDHCKTHGGPLSEAKCEVVVTFKNLCAAEAEDPQPGTPGAGWAIGTDKAAAEKMAMVNCTATAGKTRIQFCKVVSSICDGKQ
jgi:hypothetical protein